MDSISRSPSIYYTHIVYSLLYILYCPSNPPLLIDVLFFVRGPKRELKRLTTFPPCCSSVLYTVLKKETNSAIIAKIMEEFFRKGCLWTKTFFGCFLFVNFFSDFWAHCTSKKMLLVVNRLKGFMGTWHMTPGANRVVTDHLTSFKLIGVSLKSCSKKFTGHCASKMTEVITQKVFQAKIQSNFHWVVLISEAS